MGRPLLCASVSKIKSFEDFLHASEDEHWLNEENLINTLKGIYIPNDKTLYGHAFHNIIEHPTEFIGGGISEGIPFNAEQAGIAIQYASDHLLMQKELSTYKIYRTKHFDLMVTMRVDGLEGITVRDVKTKYSTVNMQEYINSCQWKFYLDALSLDIFYYDVFQVSRYDTIADAHKAVIKPLEPMQVVRYPNMLTDLQLLLEGFAEYIVSRGFTDLLELKTGSRAENQLMETI